MLIQLSAAIAAAYAKDYNSQLFGDDLIKNAAWGTGQLRLRVDTTIGRGACWNISNGDITQVAEISLQLQKYHITILQEMIRMTAFLNYKVNGGSQKIWPRCFS